MNATGLRAVLLAGGGAWPPELGAKLSGEGFAAESVAEISSSLSRVRRGNVRALLVLARPLSASDLLVLRGVREASPRTAIVVVTHTPTDPDLKRAFESGATAFLSWPASSDALRHALESGDLTTETGPGQGGHDR